MPIQAIASQRLYRQIAEQLRALIQAGEFSAAARLPAERDLARQLGVSRPSVREALIALEVEGWVEVRIGSGIYVCERAAPPERAMREVSDWGPLELVRARRLVEGELAALAAVKVRRHDIGAMEGALDAMREDAERGVVPLEHDHEFHLLLAQASGNAVLTDTVQGFWESRRSPLFLRLSGYFEDRRAWNAVIDEHEAVLAALRARDADAARAAMHRHMDKAHARLSASWRRAKGAK